MNKYKITTILEEGKYVGIVLNNEEIIFKTTPQNTPNEASALMTQFIKQNPATSPGQFVRVTQQPVPGILASQLSPSPETSVPAPQTPLTPPPAPRKCCGRQ